MFKLLRIARNDLHIINHVKYIFEISYNIILKLIFILNLINFLFKETRRVYSPFGQTALQAEPSLKAVLPLSSQIMLKPSGLASILPSAVLSLEQNRAAHSDYIIVVHIKVTHGVPDLINRASKVH